MYFRESLKINTNTKVGTPLSPRRNNEGKQALPFSRIYYTASLRHIQQ